MSHHLKGLTDRLNEMEAPHTLKKVRAAINSEVLSLDGDNPSIDYIQAFDIRANNIADYREEYVFEREFLQDIINDVLNEFAENAAKQDKEAERVEAQLVKAEVAQSDA